MASIITLIRLHTEGRLTIGDVFHHSEKGVHTLINVLDEKRITVKDDKDKYFIWEIDFGDDAQIVQIF
jgi:hypothetical protein